jgi:hypothetical protein
MEPSIDVGDIDAGFARPAIDVVDVDFESVVPKSMSPLIDFDVGDVDSGSESPAIDVVDVDVRPLEHLLRPVEPAIDVIDVDAGALRTPHRARHIRIPRPG